MVLPAKEGAKDVMAELMPTDEDLLYEEELLRNPYSLKLWWRYLDARKDATEKRRYLLYERALKSLPGSYKLWHSYLQERLLAVRPLPVSHKSMTALNNTFERALVTMHKMPRIWIMYLEFLVRQRLVTKTRRTFDKALSALPITQHDRIWQLYLTFIRGDSVPVETALRVYRRYLKLEPTHAEEYIAYLQSKELWGEAARRLAQLVNDDGFRSLAGKSKHQLWLELCDIITKQPDAVKDMPVDAILRGGIRKFTDEVGRLWCSLADYYIRRGMFEKARDIYEEGMTTVVTVRDFSMVFDALTQFEESLISAKMENEAEEDEAPEPEEGDDGTDFLLKDDGRDLDLRLARLEWLTERRPELLSSVMLRQNPHNVHEWHKRVKLFGGNPTKQILTYTEAVKTVDSDKAVGKPHTLWAAFAKFYERHGDLKNARIIFEKGCAVRYKYVDDLASLWCEWAEMELRHDNFQEALNLMRRATAAPPGIHLRKRNPEEESKLPPQERLYRSAKLWTFYVDLEESLGTLESTKACYDQIIDLRIATPQIILNYAVFLQENKHWEESFKVYEKGVSLFKYPHVKDIWECYLKQFTERYGGKKLERSRDLFEQALQQAPPKESKPLFLQYAQLEEKHGLARHAMEIYERASKRVPESERLGIYDIYLKRASDFFGIGKVREIYETAIEAQPPEGLSDADTRTLCMRYAKLECQLGEIDRARAIYVHASHLCDPRKDREFWEDWNSFEVKHGNEDTFREMLRIKRSVAAAYSMTHFNTSAPALEEDPTNKRKREEGDSMASLEAEAQAAISAAPKTNISGFVSAGTIQQDEGNTDATATGNGETKDANPEEIDIDAGEEAGGDGSENGVDDSREAENQDFEPDVQIGQKEVPSSVFSNSGIGSDKVGALERLKKRKTG
uniref:Pre-mRNA-splicing factor SYF1 n=1 Tax=Tetraselmis sp. GSL018 TaxID=582737 RepID=A0A061S5R0_9CHLO|mmetsp:Transcript_357/g.742  ORF Transcript_357/g.742 Transcript_357/m.742 type:complete len:908 (-) Transcript_357:226-2949(-)